MKAERWQSIERLYHSALEHVPERRTAFLAEACAGDDELRREVESLLAYEDDAKSFIESPALEVAAQLMSEDERAAVVAGQTINHYRITSLIGAGGMGEVYLAEDTRLGRRVALKFLPAHFTEDQRHLRRFEQEARAVAALSHPNVCTIHEVVETDEGRHCIVMEYVEGVTLRGHMAEGQMKVSEALDVATQVASALSAAHAAGVVHRDIKPENIMLRRDGYVKILDFGLAKLTEKRPERLDSEAKTEPLDLKTTPGVVMGTVAYMSPEQARGLPVDARTDVWSLGVVLYETVAGQLPFTGPTPTDVIISIAERDPVPLRSLASEVPARLEQIVNKALAKDRGQRYQTVEELLTDLKHSKRGLEIANEVERPKLGTTRGESEDQGRRNLIKSPLFLAALVGLLIIAALASALLLRQRLTPARQTEIKSLALLPLENLSPDTSQDYFADGMTEALITDLGRTGELRVISLPSVIPYKGTRKTPPEIARELNVDAVLKGSVARSGERVRIAVQLIDAATGRPLWDHQYDRDMRDVLALQKEVTRDIGGQIGIKVMPAEQVQVENVRPVDPEAYEEYLRGRFFLHRQNKEDNETAIGALERAVARDPGFAEGHAELAQAYVWKLFLFAPNEEQLAEKAFVATEKALALDPDSAVAHLARGRILWTPANRFPHEKAIREYRRALALNPNLDEARNQLALVYCHIGAFGEAVQQSQQAIATNPNNNLAQFRIGETLNFQGKYEQALSILRAIPKDVNPALVGHQIAWSLFNLGKKEEASATIEQFLKDYPEDNRGLFTSLQAVLAASAGQGQTAEDKIKFAVVRGKGFGHFHHTAYNIACAYALMNKPDQAIKWLEVTADDGFPCYPLFEKDPNLDKLRQDVRFVTFMEKQRQQWEHYKTIL